MANNPPSAICWKKIRKLLEKPCMIHAGIPDGFGLSATCMQTDPHKNLRQVICAKPACFRISATIAGEWKVRTDSDRYRYASRSWASSAPIHGITR